MPTPKFCTQCGAPLEPDSAFCTRCGAPVTEQTEVVEGAPAGESPVSKTVLRQLPQTDAPVAETDTLHQDSPDQPVAQAKGTHHGRGILIGCLCAAAIAAVAIFAFTNLNGQGQGDSNGATTVSQQDSSQGGKRTVVLQDNSVSNPSQDANSDSSTDSGSQSNASSDASSSSSSPTPSTTSSTSSQSSAAQADQAFHDTLVDYYKALPRYSDRIKSVASTFNTNFMSDNLSLRQSNSQDASSLLSELQQQRDGLAGLSVPSGSSWATQYQQTLQCYDYNIARLGCIVKAWSIDVSYSNPSGHKDEILSPIKADNASNGHNINKQRYESLYPQINL